MSNKPENAQDHSTLRQHAEEQLKTRPSIIDSVGLLHELKVHELELEMQNNELCNARDDMESMLAKYTDLYDFAPVGYFSLDAHGCILEANLTGARMLGLTRSALLNKELPRFIIPKSRPGFQSFLQRVLAGPESQSYEAALAKEDGSTFWVTFQGSSSFYMNIPQEWCRVAMSDISAIKLAEEAQLHLDDMARANATLQDEIKQRKVVEKELRESEQKTRQLLEQLRHLSRRILTVQEEERKRISRELHDEITQTLIGINVHLESLAHDSTTNVKDFHQKVAKTQKLVEHSVTIAHRFAEDLRPPVLDDLGLIPALHASLKSFMKTTGVRATLKAFADVEKLDSDQRTALYRVAQEALANVARHAHASRTDVVINKQSNCVHMYITDNGRSFEIDQILHSRERMPLGLIGMRERMEMVGGAFSINSTPGNGTTVTATLPLSRDAKASSSDEC
jgi:PAS domain S-box-containing protein